MLPQRAQNKLVFMGGAAQYAPALEAVIDGEALAALYALMGEPGSPRSSPQRRATTTWSGGMSPLGRSSRGFSRGAESETPAGAAPRVRVGSLALSV